MSLQRMDIERRQVILHSTGLLCSSASEIAESHAFAQLVQAYVDVLRKHNSPLLDDIRLDLQNQDGVSRMVDLLRALASTSLEEAARDRQELLPCVEGRKGLHGFVEGLYDYWREHHRFMILHSLPGPSSMDRRPYRAFNSTVEQFTHLIRGLYRDVCENVTGDHPRVYRQVAAGANAGLIAVPAAVPLPAAYARVLADIPFIRQVWMDPPLIIDPPINKRTGSFLKIARNPLEDVSLETPQFLCYPAQVGPLVVFIYVHQRFLELGCSLANLFELAGDRQIETGPDAVFVYGAPSERMLDFGALPTVFFDDEENRLLVAAVPLEDRFGYFGYLKKMVLTLHNIVMMKRGRMPFHGAMVHIALKSGSSANVLLIGDTATGKSESLEAFRVLGEDAIRELRVVADDMGSLEVDSEGRLLAYGTEIGAFLRLDDLRQGYAFGQIDRAVIMSPQKINARCVLPVTTLDDVLEGHPVDYLLYANNYEEVDAEHPIIERYASAEEAIKVFREGAAMSKGTTTATGLVHSYFANIFGPPQYKELHEPLAQKIFAAAFQRETFVGQLRTRLGVPGSESQGPEEAAKALLELIAEKK
jgi:hypothetical protein